MTILLLLLAGILIMVALSMVSWRRDRRRGGSRSAGYFGTDPSYLPLDSGHHHGYHHHHHHDGGGSSWGDGGSSGGDGGGGS